MNLSTDLKNHEDTLLIKINKSYRDDITEEELYEATSISWVISEGKLSSGNIRYYCAVYQNEIKEVYAFNGFEKDIDRKGRFILKGSKVDEPTIRQLIGKNVKSIHRSSGNPIKGSNMAYLLDFNDEREEAKEMNLDITPDTVEDLFIDEATQQQIVRQICYKKNVILQGPPGVGKTFAAKKLLQKWFSVDSNQILSLQFHQSYSYEDFIEGYRPNDRGEFELKQGIFQIFVDRAKNDRGNDYFVLIDEINRGNVSKIFGELFMLIEKDKREEKLQLAYSQKEFLVPNNLYIIGTMNTADRSLNQLDYAIRRRFSFISLYPAFEGESLNKFKSYLDVKGVSNETIMRIVKNISEVNDAIRRDPQLGEGFEIGHSYFTNLDNSDDEGIWYSDIVEFELLPLLKEYCLDDKEKLNEYKGILFQ